MSEVMLALGRYRFSIDGAAYDELRRTDEYRWAPQNLIGQAPALQFIGPGASTIEVKGTIYPHYKGGLRQIDTMRTIAGKGEALLLVDGRGWRHGTWAIERIEGTETHQLPNGAPLKMEFRLSLKKYGD